MDYFRDLFATPPCPPAKKPEVDNLIRRTARNRKKG